LGKDQHDETWKKGCHAPLQIVTRGFSDKRVPLLSAPPRMYSATMIFDREIAMLGARFYVSRKG
jgi:hypothetical protein